MGRGRVVLARGGDEAHSLAPGDAVVVASAEEVPVPMAHGGGEGDFRDVRWRVFDVEVEFLCKRGRGMRFARALANVLAASPTPAPTRRPPTPLSLPPSLFPSLAPGHDPNS